MEGFKKWLAEMAVNMRHLGNWSHQKALPFVTDPGEKKDLAKFKDYGWKWDDFQMLNNDVALEKIAKKCSRVSADIDAYFLRSYQASKHIEVGEVDTEYLERELGLKVVSRIDPSKPPQNQIVINPNAITCVFTNNQGAERMPWSCWTMMHRLGHALRRTPRYQEYTKALSKELIDILERIYGISKSGPGYLRESGLEKELRALCNAIGTMKSARNGNLRNYFEFAHELFAQYLTQNQITFNPLPQNFGKRYAWGRPSPKHFAQHGTDLEEESEALLTLSHDMEYYIDQAISGAVGRIFVM